MPPSESAGGPSEWLSRARSNLLRARQPKPEGVFWEDLCFDAQQAAEKAIKTLLIARGVRFRYVHDIAELVSSLDQAGVEIPEEIRAVTTLTYFAVTARYPGATEPVTEEEYLETIALAEATVTWVEGHLFIGE